MRKITIACLTVALFCANHARADWVTHYDAQLPGATNTVMRGISVVNGENIVGYYYDGANYHGFEYDGGTNASSWTTLDATNLGAVDTYACGASGGDTVGLYVVGYYNNGTNINGFFYHLNKNVYFRNTTVTGAINTCSRGVSDDGTVVGYYDDGTNYHGFYGPFNNTAMHGGFDATSLGAIDTRPQGISADGNNIVGSYYDGTNWHGFECNYLTNWTTLDATSLGAVDTYACGIYSNNIVGYYWDGTSTNGFEFDGANWTTMNVPGAINTCVYGIHGNSLVATYWDSLGSHGAIYTPLKMTIQRSGHGTITLRITGGRDLGSGSIYSIKYSTNFAERFSNWLTAVQLGIQKGSGGSGKTNILTGSVGNDRGAVFYPQLSPP